MTQSERNLKLQKAGSETGRAIIQFLSSGERQIVDFDEMLASDFLHYSEVEAATGADLYDWDLDNEISMSDLRDTDGSMTYKVL